MIKQSMTMAATRNDLEGAQCHDHILAIVNEIEVVKVIRELPVAQVVDIGADGDGLILVKP